MQAPLCQQSCGVICITGSAVAGEGVAASTWRELQLQLQLEPEERATRQVLRHRAEKPSDQKEARDVIPWPLPPFIFWSIFHDGRWIQLEAWHQKRLVDKSLEISFPGESRVEQDSRGGRENIQHHIYTSVRSLQDGEDVIGLRARRLEF